LYLFINERAGDKNDIFYIVLMALILIPKNYIFLPTFTSPLTVGNKTFPIDVNCSISLILNPLLLSAAMIMIMKESMKEWVKGRNWRH
jgi:hypothetical protein